jgi:hypothetical protein
MAHTITKTQITAQPKSIFDPMPKVIATFSDGTVKELFQYYPDEIFFTESDFEGLTEHEARALRHRKDMDYLQS